MALEAELKTYKDNREKLLAEHLGEFVIIHGNKIIDTMNDYEDALKIGYKTCGLVPFLVKKIEAVETVHRI